MAVADPVTGADDGCEVGDGRFVLLLCGPPGAGKTTYAHALAARHGLEVFDLDDPRWRRSERQFSRALRNLGRSPGARAVVIRAGATRSARSRAATMVRASAVRVMATDEETCRARIVARGRRVPPIRTQIAALRTWWQRYESGPVDVVPAARGVVGATSARGYGTRHQAIRRQWARMVGLGGVRCARCGGLIVPGEPWDLGHVDGDRSRYAGPEHRACNRATNTPGRVTAGGGGGRGRRRPQSRRW